MTSSKRIIIMKHFYIQADPKDPGESQSGNIVINAKSTIDCIVLPK